jgi:HEAT repeat protein
LYRLISDELTYVRWSAVEALGAVFQYVPDKQKAWNELIKLTNSEDLHIRDMAASVIGSAFSQVPDKYQAWNDLHELTSDQDDFVRFFAPKAICCAFPYIPDKQQAWDDLIELSNDVSIDVEYNAANVLGSVFSQMLDKQQAWNDLIKSTTGEGGYFGFYAYHTLGNISIFNASQVKTEKDYKKELEKAIAFFEKEVQVLNSDLDLCSIDNPSEFCLPFYRSFHAIVFKKHEAKEEVDKYLSEAKDAVRGSESKELLFEAVENLANALKEVQNMENMDLRKMQGELNFYRKYCDRAAELMIKTEETAPFATATLKRGLPILDRNLKELLEEIQKKTEVIREQTKGTPFEKLGNDLNEGSLSLLQVRDLVGFKKQVQNLENKLSSMCSKLSEGQKGEACELLKTIHEEHSIEDKIPLINDVLSKFSYQLDMITCLNRIDASLSSVNKKVDELIIISRPGISEEVVISTGFELAGSGFQHSVTIPLQEISYSELKEDLEKITGTKIDKLSKIPRRLANKIKGYLLLHDKEDVLEKLT